MAKKVGLNIDEASLKTLKLVAVAYSDVKRDYFPTDEAYQAELEVVERAKQVSDEVKKLGIETKLYPADQYFLTNLLIDKPDLVINLVDTIRGADRMSTAIPAFLSYANIPFTGCDITGMAIGNNRHLFKQLLRANSIPTPDYKYIKDLRSNTPPDFEPPYIVKLNESGGSVGIDNHAVKETVNKVIRKVEELKTEYGIPVLIEKFIDGQELTVIVFDDGNSRQVFPAKKKFGLKPDGKHSFTSLESYDDAHSYKFELLDEDWTKKITDLSSKAFEVLKLNDYAKFDIRVDAADQTPYFIDCNPNTAFGPDLGLPMTDILRLHGIEFPEILSSLLSKHAKTRPANQ